MATKFDLRLAGSTINFNRRDPSMIYNAVLASWNGPGLIRMLLHKSRVDNAFQGRKDEPPCRVWKHGLRIRDPYAEYGQYVFHILMKYPRKKRITNFLRKFSIELSLETPYIFPRKLLPGTRSNFRRTSWTFSRKKIKGTVSS